MKRQIRFNFLKGSAGHVKHSMGQEEMRPRTGSKSAPFDDRDAPEPAAFLPNCSHLSQLRVGAVDPTLVAERWNALIYVPGSPSGPIGPIDLPFTFNVEQDIELEIYPLSTLQTDQVMQALLCDLPNSPNLYSATFFPTINGTDATDIPPWVVAVTVYSGNTATFYDLANNAIGSCTGPQLVARPRNAKTVIITGEGTAAILYHY